MHKLIKLFAVLCSVIGFAGAAQARVVADPLVGAYAAPGTPAALGLEYGAAQQGRPVYLTNDPQLRRPEVYGGYSVYNTGGGYNSSGGRPQGANCRDNDSGQWFFASSPEECNYLSNRNNNRYNQGYPQQRYSQQQMYQAPREQNCVGSVLGTGLAGALIGAGTGGSRGARNGAYIGAGVGVLTGCLR
jgi:hypothetical protein